MIAVGFLIDDKAHLNEYLDLYDIVITNEHGFGPVLTILNQIAGFDPSS